MMSKMVFAFESFPGGIIKATAVVKHRATARGFKDGMVTKGFKPEQVQILKRHDGQFTVLVTCTAQEVLKLVGGR